MAERLVRRVLYPVSRSLRDDLVEEAVTKTRTA
jgi:hypothetical protein